MDNDEFTTCPYDVTHRIRRSRIQHHLVKCEKNSPKLWICPFNATHRYPDSLKMAHISNCPSTPIDEPKPKATAAKVGTIGAITSPKPILQKEYIPDSAPENEIWDD